MKLKNIKSLFVLLIGIAMIFSISACGGAAGNTDSGNTDAAATEAPADATEAPAMTEAPAGDIVAAFDFNNKGDKEICEMYLSPDQTAWGDDQLQGNTIPAGEKFTLKNIPAGVYNVKSVFCDGGEEILPDINISN
jgi:hypothetical protein